MTKKENKLYTVNKYNKNLFYPGGPISIANNFLQSYKPNPYQGWQTTPDVSLSESYDTIDPDRSWTLYPKIPTTGINVGPLTFNKTNIGLSHGYTLPQKIDYTKPITGLDFINTRSIGTVPAFQPNTSIIGMDKLGDRGVGLGVTDAKTAADNIVSNNPLTKDMIKGNTDSTPKKKVDWGKIGGMAAAAVPDYLYNELDPVYHIADGKESKVGNALNETGINMFKAGAQSGNGWLMLAGAGAKVAGGAYNTLFGAKWNDANINKIKANTTALRTVGNEL
jgi:hypothetical protein